MPRLNSAVKKLLFLTTIGIMVYLLSSFALMFRKQRRLTHLEISGPNTSAYLVNMPSCKIPNIDPFDISIRHLVRRGGPQLCPHRVSLTFQRETTLFINWTAVNEPPYYGDLKYCTFTPIYRPKHEETDHDFLRYLEESEPFKDTLSVKDDFIRVSCYNSSDLKIYINFHAFIHRSTTDSVVRSRRFIEYVQSKTAETLNVLMIGIDSVSRLNSIRQLENTRKFLVGELGAIEMNGYTKVADNTFVNIVPMTMGQFVSDLPNKETRINGPFDNYNFIWKQFASHGYRTLYAEDAPEIAIFDYKKNGFRIPPADYYNRPFSLALELQQSLWFNNHHCFQDRLETEIVINYVYDFIDTFRSGPYFGFTFITRLTHDDINSAGAADEPYSKFFEKLKKEGLLHKTVLFFYSDHGIRFGRIRETFVGRVEERLPFMFIVVPKWLREKYPYITKNLKLNQDRLSTPFDVYETLQDILYFKPQEMPTDPTARGVSWFREIPINRGCDEAGILPHWCMCRQRHQLSITDKMVQRTAFTLYNVVTQIILPYPHLCEHLILAEIINALKLSTSLDSSESKGKNSFEDIQIVIRTTPGNALLEATVRVDLDTETYKVVGDISRINMYGHQADCIEDFTLKKFCQCKDFQDGQPNLKRNQLAINN
ncbi:hypothetical protein ACJMK2_041670 [Sinanodonta woodiana]|uniref:Uncharacterized protein n=1 Tax=Sinanodonta woodiana TaxID=1069815 RepID=A0ABD3W4W1_SINWO